MQRVIKSKGRGWYGTIVGLLGYDDIFLLRVHCRCGRIRVVERSPKWPIRQLQQKLM